MSDLLGLAFDAAIVGGGLLSIGYTLWRAPESRQRAGTDTTPQPALRVWTWRLVRDLCGGMVALCFGGYLLLRDVGVGGFDWLIIAGFFPAVGIVVALLMLADLGALR